VLVFPTAAAGAGIIPSGLHANVLSKIKGGVGPRPALIYAFLSSIHFAAVPHAHYPYGLGFLIDFVNDSIVPNSDTPIIFRTDNFRQPAGLCFLANALI